MSKIDYDLSLIKGVVFDVDGVLSPCLVPMDADGIPRRMVNIHDGYALQLAVRKGIKLAIVSGATGAGLEKRFSNLGIKDVYLRVGVKKDVFLDWMKANGLKPEEVAFVGDDVPDSECIDIAGLSVAPADASADILEKARYISPACGGHGVARDLLEEILRAQHKWPTTDRAFGWNDNK